MTVGSQYSNLQGNETWSKKSDSLRNQAGVKLQCLTEGGEMTLSSSYWEVGKIMSSKKSGFHSVM